jgi:hypothetical protein
LVPGNKGGESYEKKMGHTAADYVRVTWRLIMMWVWNKTSYGSKDSEWFNFKVSGLWDNIRLISGNI